MAVAVAVAVARQLRRLFLFSKPVGPNLRVSHVSHVSHVSLFDVAVAHFEAAARCRLVPKGNCGGAGCWLLRERICALPCVQSNLTEKGHFDGGFRSIVVKRQWGALTNGCVDFTEKYYFDQGFLSNFVKWHGRGEMPVKWVSHLDRKMPF